MSPAAEDRICCAVLTPLGRGAIATVGVRGKIARELVGRRFAPASGRSLAEFPIDRVIFGRFRAGNAAGEELVVGLIGPEEVEIHCHGGTAAVQAVVAALVAEGCEQVTPEAWSRLAEPDAIRAAALVALSQARTERTAAILLDQYRGALSAELNRISSALQAGDTEAASAAIDRLLGHRQVGLHLTMPWRVVLAGRPNVGKSSLINALLGYQRAIVFDQPGTTRDVLTGAAAFAGWPVELVDIAGLRTGGDAIEVEGVARARSQIAQADLVLLVVDATQPWTAEDRQLAADLPSAVFVLHNKCDLSPPPADSRPAGLAISAKTGLGLDALVQTLGQRLVPTPPAPGAAVPFNAAQFELLMQARQCLKASDIAEALDRIAAL